MPVDHVKLPVRDLEASRAFFEAALAPFGYRLVYDGETSLGFGVGDGGNEDEPFAVERREAPGMPTHIAFTAASIEQVDAFHTAALSAGGEDNGAPGKRPYGGYYYAAFILDPDGHTSRPSTTATGSCVQVRPTGARRATGEGRRAG